MCVHCSFSSVWVAEWPTFGKKLPARLAICSHCILSICNIYLFPALVLKAGLPFGCASSCSLLLYYFYENAWIPMATNNPILMDGGVHTNATIS